MNIPVVTLDVGDSFSTIKELKDICAMQNTFEYEPEKSDKSRYTIVCRRMTALSISMHLHSSVNGSIYTTISVGEQYI